MGRTRIYTKYPTCFGKLGLRGLADAAEANGMAVLGAYKPGFCCWNTLIVRGTPEAMRKTTDDWEAEGHEVPPRKPPGAF